MTLDESALAKAADALERTIATDASHAARIAIEAYEAAKPSPWRPIEDAPRDGTEIFGYVHGYTYQPGLLKWHGGGWLAPGLDTWDAAFLAEEGALWRTIDPPSPASTSPAAEDDK